jgi:hypothetical protein
MRVMKSGDLDDMGRICRTHANKKCECVTLVGKAQDKRPLFRNWLKLDDIVKTDIKERIWT